MKTSWKACPLWRRLTKPPASPIASSSIGVQARVAQRYRSRYMAAVRNAWGDTSYTTIEPEKVVDFQVGYAFEKGAYKGLSVLFQINNLTNEAYRTMMTVDSNSGTVPSLLYPGIYEKYGRQYLIGLNYKF